MKRRRLILGLGGLASLGGSLVGTGAFTSVSAERDIAVETADDANAFLAMVPIDSPNGDAFATTQDGLILLEFTNTDAGGSGLGTDSVYDFDDVFRVTNQGTQPVYVWAVFADASGDFNVGTSDTDVWFYAHGDSDNKLRDSADDVLYLTPGADADIGVHVDTDDLNEGQDLTATINADASKPADGGTVVGREGTSIPGPTDGLTGYWPLNTVGDGTAEDAVGGADASVPSEISSTAGKTGEAAEFPEADVAIQPNPNAEATMSFSVAVWLNAAGFDQTSYPLAVSKWQRAQNRDYLIGYNGPEDQLYAQFNREPDGNKTTLFGPTPEVDVWYHCVLTYDRNGVGRFYVDGTEVDSARGAFNSTSSQFVIGTKDGGGNSWHGRIDDVRIYSRALDPGEVTALYDSTR
ncbi:LamG domain-containing protein [Halorubrum sp. SD690R]|nr:LamG domain-containing protein [Halorubrum sp. SD690R]